MTALTGRGMTNEYQFRGAYCYNAGVKGSGQAVDVVASPVAFICSRFEACN